jgi:hypothetical protein
VPDRHEVGRGAGGAEADTAVRPDLEQRPGAAIGRLVELEQVGAGEPGPDAVLVPALGEAGLDLGERGAGSGDEEEGGG